ncbi:MAG: NAD-dependent epimerase/dehydratase family protein [Myxococcales bacterium]|nr:NAD-dependent epimerase/dehydratase family protein [Myxococcales bacterium]
MSEQSSAAARRVAVTGATGQVGNVLVRALNQRGVDPRAVVRKTSDVGALDGARYERAEGDVSSLDSLVEAFRGCDTVFHSAALVTISDRHETALRKTNYEGTRNVLEACERAGVRRLVYVSSVHALTEPSEGVLDEAAGFDEHRAYGAYGRSKAAASALVQKHAREGRVDAVLVLPTGVIGPHDYRLSPQAKMVVMLGQGKMPVTMEGGFHWVDVRDVAEGAILAGERGSTGEAYIVDGERVTTRQIGDFVANCAGVRPPFAAVPLKLAAPFARLAPIYERLTGKDAIFSPSSVHTLSAPYRVSSDKARRELGFAPRPVRVAFEDAWKWLRDAPTSPLRRARVG